MANSRFACMAITLLLCCVNGIVALDDTQQTEPKETPEKQEIKVKTELMEVRTVVTDKKGRIVEDLKKEDFELLENDQPQEISFFSVSKMESARSKPAEPAHAEAKTPEKAAELQPVQKRLNETPVRTTLLLVDNLHTSFASLNRIKEAVRRFIKERLTDQDMVALVTTGQTLGIAQQFTRNRQILNYAVEQIRLGPHLQDESSFPFKLSADIVMNRGDSLRLGVAMIRQELNQICPCQVMVALARNRPFQSLAEASNSRRVTLATLRGYAEQMVNLPGKRMIVVFSDGFTMYDNDGAVHDNEVQPVIDRAVRSGVVVYSILARGLEGPSTIDAGKKPAVAVSMDQINHVYVTNPAAQANATGPLPYQCLDDVPACSVPPSQELYQNYVNMSEQEELNGLNSIAEATGGKMYNDTNDLGDALGRAFEANHYYYVLSYYLTSRNNNNQFRRIKVRVRNHPEYTIRTARGFSAAETMAKEEDAGKTPQQRLMKSMNAPLPVTDLGVSAQADFLENGNDDKQVSLTVYFDGDRFKYREQDQLHHVETRDHICGL